MSNEMNISIDIDELLSRPVILYAVTVLLEAPVVLLRIAIVWSIATILLLITGNPVVAADSWALLALIPTIWSVSALLPQWTSTQQSRIALGSVLGLIVFSIVVGAVMLGLATALLSLFVLVSPWATGWWWRTRVGGRKPSNREQTAYDDALRTLQDQAGGELPLPEGWFVLDLPQPEAAVFGRTLMLTHGMLESPALAAVIAHELGHLAALDSRMSAALNRLVIRPLREPHPDQERYTRQLGAAATDVATKTVVAAGLSVIFARALLKGCRGGLGLWLLQAFWGAQWRHSEYQADQYAASLGQAHDLAEFLQTNALIYDQPVPFTWLTTHTHPPAELRIDRLTTTKPAESVSDNNGYDPTVQYELPGLHARGL